MPRRILPRRGKAAALAALGRGRTKAQRKVAEPETSRLHELGDLRRHFLLIGLADGEQQRLGVGPADELEAVGKPRATRHRQRDRRQSEVVDHARELDHAAEDGAHVRAAPDIEVHDRRQRIGQHRQQHHVGALEGLVERPLQVGAARAQRRHVRDRGNEMAGLEARAHLRAVIVGPRAQVVVVGSRRVGLLRELRQLVERLPVREGRVDRLEAEAGENALHGVEHLLHLRARLPVDGGIDTELHALQAVVEMIDVVGHLHRR